MRLTDKQKQFKKLHGYTIVELNGVICSLKDDGTCVPATGEEFGLFLQFTPKTIFREIKKDFQYLWEIISLKHELFRRWQFKVLCDAKSKLHNNQRYYVLTDLNGDYRVINRDGFNLLKAKGQINKHANFMDLLKEAIYYSEVKK